MSISISSPIIKVLRYDPEEQIEQDDEATIRFEILNPNKGIAVKIDEIEIRLDPNDLKNAPVPASILSVTRPKIVAGSPPLEAPINFRFSVDGGVSYNRVTGDTTHLSALETISVTAALDTTTAPHAAYPYESKLKVRLDWEATIKETLGIARAIDLEIAKD